MVTEFDEQLESVSLPLSLGKLLSVVLYSRNHKDRRDSTDRKVRGKTLSLVFPKY